jgi:hypothetical protein
MVAIVELGAAARAGVDRDVALELKSTLSNVARGEPRAGLSM